MAHFKKGDIVYWICPLGIGDTNPKTKIRWGVVEDEFTDGVLVTIYVVKDWQTCDGIPVTKIDFPTKWKQLPKNWTYNTKLFEVGCSLNPEEYNIANKFIRGEYIGDKDILKGMIQEGLLIPAYDTMHFDNGHIESEIEHGRYRLLYRHNSWTHELSQKTLRWNELYDTWIEAEKVVEKELSEWKRISNLSDYEYAVWDMEDRLAKWRTPNMTDEFVNEIKDWLMQLSPLEDYEFRGVAGGFQYKKIKNTKWLTVGISTEVH